MTNAVVEAEMTGQLAASLIRLRSGRLGVSRQEARRSVARETRVAGGTITGLLRGTAKGVKGYLRDQIAALVSREIQAEIRRLQHEEQLARQIGGGAMQVDLAEIEASLAALKALIGERTGQ